MKILIHLYFRYPVTLCAAALFLVSGPTQVKADNLAYFIGETSNKFLYSLDLDTGVSTEIGNSSWGNASTQVGLAEYDGILYAESLTGVSATATSLYTLNTSTGAKTLVGEGSVELVAMGETASGLYGVGDDANFYSINPTTGATTEINSDNPFVCGSKCYLTSGSATLYYTDGSGDLYTVDTSTGEPTMVGGTNAMGADINSLVYENGTLYGIANNDTSSPYGVLYTINTTTGVATANGKSTGFVFNFAAPAAEAPEPSTLWLTFAGFGLAGLGSRLRRQRIA